MYVTGAGNEELLAAVAFNDEVLRMPLVNPAERYLVGLVVCCYGFVNPSHSLTSFHCLSASGKVRVDSTTCSRVGWICGHTADHFISKTPHPTKASALAVL